MFFQGFNGTALRKRQRHQSANDLSDTKDNNLRRRQRILSSNGVKDLKEEDEESLESSSNKRHLRVGVERIRLTRVRHVKDEVKEESETEIDEEPVTLRRSRTLRQKQNTRSGAHHDDSPSVSPKRKKPRSELDKLLEAGSSSFHFETAKQAENRKEDENGLGPIHIDVSEHSSSSQEDHRNAKVSTKKGLRKSKRVKEMVSEEEEEEEDEEEEKPVTRVSQSRKAKKVLRTRKREVKKMKKLRRPILTKEDLMEGPAFIPPKHELDSKKPKKPLKKHSAMQKRAYLPSELFEDLKRRLDEVSGEAIDVDDMQFSFERTPVNEGWFQTYSRQDQGDEISFYLETKSILLPYEMPNTTFYPSKTGGKKRKLFGNPESSHNTSVNPSGTATPEEDLPTRKVTRSRTESESLKPPSAKALRKVKKNLNKRKDSKASSTDSDSSSMQRRSGILARLGPKANNLLLEFSRKSPRCHASTKALLIHNNPNEDDYVDVETPPEIPSNAAILIDECSNDSIASTKVIPETPGQLCNLASSLDSFLTENDPLLVTDAEEEPDAPKERLIMLQKKKKRSRSNSGKVAKHPLLPDDPMDRLVASNVDPVLLDCLEDELPSVAIDEEMPGSEPLELLANYQYCESMAKCGNFKWTRRKSLTQIASPKIVAKNDVSNTSAVKSKASIAPVHDDTSSEYDGSSACESVSSGSVSSSQSRKRRKRNMTGFPSPKKKKKKSLLNDVLTRNSGRVLHQKTKKSAKKSEEEDENDDSDVEVIPIKKKKKKLITPKRLKQRTAANKNNKSRKYKEPETDEDELSDDDEASEEDSEESEHEVIPRATRKLPKRNLKTRGKLKTLKVKKNNMRKTRSRN